MIVVTNRIPVSKGHEIDFEDRFKKRVHLVDRSPGFVRNEVHRPKPVKFSHETGGWVEDTEAQGYYEVKTWWRSAAGAPCSRARGILESGSIS
jgi:heme-degrading monooxygenase HmoA